MIFIDFHSFTNGTNLYYTSDIKNLLNNKSYLVCKFIVAISTIKEVNYFLLNIKNKIFETDNLFFIIKTEY